MRRDGRRLNCLVFSTAAMLSIATAVEAQPRFEIDATADRGPISRDIYGANLEYIARNTPATAEFAAQFPVLRVPGGDSAQRFLWNLASRGPCRARWDWASYAALAEQHHNALFLETNMVRGNPRNSAAWVADARRRGIRVAAVAIGNEVWGTFEDGYRTADRYARDLRAHAKAIRRVDASVPIGASFGTFNEDAWNRELIRRAGDVIDFVDVHWYPNHREYERAVPGEIMAEPEAIPRVMSRIRGILREEAPAYASHIQVAFGEYDCAADVPERARDFTPGRSYSQWAMPNAVCWAATLGEMMREGVSLALFYSVQNHRAGAIPGNECTEGDARVVRPKALAHQLYREHFGDRMVEVSARDVPNYHSDGPPWWDGFQGDAPYLKTYASTADGGRSLRVIVVSRHETESLRTSFHLKGFEPEDAVRVWELAGDSVRATNENVGGAPDAVKIVARSFRVSSAEFAYSVPPHSVTAFEFTRRATATAALATTSLVTTASTLAASPSAPPTPRRTLTPPPGASFGTRLVQGLPLLLCLGFVAFSLRRRRAGAGVSAGVSAPPPPLVVDVEPALAPTLLSPSAPPPPLDPEPAASRDEALLDLERPTFAFLLTRPKSIPPPSMPEEPSDGFRDTASLPPVRIEPVGGVLGDVFGAAAHDERPPGPAEHRDVVHPVADDGDLRPGESEPPRDPGEADGLVDVRAPHEERPSVAPKGKRKAHRKERASVPAPDALARGFDRSLSADPNRHGHAVAKKRSRRRGRESRVKRDAG